jgi:hypothetical protein
VEVLQGGGNRASTPPKTMKGRIDRHFWGARSDVLFAAFWRVLLLLLCCRAFVKIIINFLEGGRKHDIIGNTQWYNIMKKKNYYLFDENSIIFGEFGRVYPPHLGNPSHFLRSHIPLIDAST